MCGPDTSNRPRGGALAALSPTCAVSGIRCDLAFHTPGSPSSCWATHARLTPEVAEAMRNEAIGDLSVVIHTTGDLTRKNSKCGLFARFALPLSLPEVSVSDSDSDSGAGDERSDYVEMALEAPVSLQVGAGGIIGRRVSLYSRARRGPEEEVLIAEGIVGFNCLSPVPAAISGKAALGC